MSNITPALHKPRAQMARRLKSSVLAVSVVAALVMAGCASAPYAQTEGGKTVSQSAMASKIQQDRQAILAMTGDYKVSFDFTETVPLRAGYVLKEPKHSGAHEVVRVIRDEPGFISLQHILVVGKETKFPIKHWRQDWVYEPDFVYDFVGFNSWEKRTLSASERKGKWAQFVYQVDDSPRYSAAAEWSHENGVSAWTSPPSLRPLPRRDMTTRDDYQGMLAVNRHALTPSGWVHEQDNTKLILTEDTPQALVREVGLNTYTKASDFEVNLADDYWEKTQDYWEGVREIWTSIETENTGFSLTIQGEPEDLYQPVMALTDKIEDEDLSVEEAIMQAAAVIKAHTTPDVDAVVDAAKAEARVQAKGQSEDDL